MTNHQLHLQLAAQLLSNDLDVNAIGINTKVVVTAEVLHDFVMHLQVEEKEHTEYKEFKKHFRNYLNRKPKNYGHTKQPADKIGRIDRAELTSYANRRNGNNQHPQKDTGS